MTDLREVSWSFVEPREGGRSRPIYPCGKVRKGPQAGRALTRRREDLAHYSSIGSSICPFFGKYFASNRLSSQLTIRYAFISMLLPFNQKRGSLFGGEHVVRIPYPT